MPPLRLRIGLRNRRSRFAQPKAQLAEQSLTLPHAQTDPKLLLDPGGQCFSIPNVAPQPSLSRRLAEDRVQLLEMGFREPFGPPGSFSFPQPGQTFRFKPVHPVLHRSRCIAQQASRFGAGQALRHQQYAMQAVIIARLFGPTDLILQSENDGFRFSDDEWLHISM